MRSFVLLRARGPATSEPRFRSPHPVAGPSRPEPRRASTSSIRGAELGVHALGGERTRHPHRVGPPRPECGLRHPELDQAGVGRGPLRTLLRRLRQLLGSEPVPSRVEVSVEHVRRPRRPRNRRGRRASGSPAAGSARSRTVLAAAGPAAGASLPAAPRARPGARRCRCRRRAAGPHARSAGTSPGAACDRRARAPATVTPVARSAAPRSRHRRSTSGGGDRRARRSGPDVPRSRRPGGGRRHGWRARASTSTSRSAIVRAAGSGHDPVSSECRPLSGTARIPAAASRSSTSTPWSSKRCTRATLSS